MTRMDRLNKVVEDNPTLSNRDMRDLLMEHGADGITASELSVYAAEDEDKD